MSTVPLHFRFIPQYNDIRNDLVLSNTVLLFSLFNYPLAFLFIIQADRLILLLIIIIIFIVVLNDVLPLRRRRHRHGKCCCCCCLR